MHKNIALPKWPAMVVVGSPVTTDQAAEILVRTFPWRYSCNDRDFERECYEVIGLERDEKFWGPVMSSLDKLTESLGLLDLQYLKTGRVFSNWVGGCYGWCDWSGRIFSNNTNIGKWPSVEEVETEWRLIAEAFPFLDLRCQLYSGETCEENIFPVVQYVVRGGKVEVTDPQPVLFAPEDSIDLAADIGTKGYYQRQKGCTVEQLRYAVDITKASLGGYGI